MTTPRPEKGGIIRHLPARRHAIRPPRAGRTAPSSFDKKRQQEDLFVSGPSDIQSILAGFDAVTFFAVIKEGLK
ncbi:hypothetical protein BN2364_2657 [Alloalcanivorax xenomutans]|nr:hypothetical protein BN2364_2657 [Alloalcanivorax xenomutans]